MTVTPRCNDNDKFSPCFMRGENKVAFFTRLGSSR